jgi:hypothetical protein
MKITLLSLVLCLLCSLNMAAQGSDIGSNPEDTTIHQLSKKELRRRKVAKRNIHYNILGGCGFTVCKSQWRIIGFPFNLKIRRRTFYFDFCKVRLNDH